MNIRMGTKEDIIGILPIMNHYIEHSTTTFDLEKKSIQDLEKWYIQFESGYPLLVTEDNGKIVGYAYLSPFRPKEAYKRTVELSIYLAPDVQGKGIGKQLMEAILNEAVKRGFSTILSIITTENKSSISFHEKFGFEHVGQLQKVGYKHDRWLDVSFFQKFIN